MVILAQGDEASRRHSAEEFPFSGTTFCSRVIRVTSEIGEKKRITAGLLGATPAFTPGAVRFWTRPFTGEHSPPCLQPTSPFAVHDLQFYEDGRKIARYANTLPGSFFLREEVV